MQTTRNRKVGAAAVAVVALAGVGTALAASKLNGHSGTSNAVAQRAFAGVPERETTQRDRDDDRRGFGFRGPARGGLSAAATYLGLSEQQLFDELQSGRSLAQIADAISGKSASGLVDAIVAQETSTIDAAVESGRITRALADRVEADLKQRVSRLVNGSLGFGSRGRGLGPPTAPSGDQDSASPM